jgi:hypothetical protein
MATLKEQAWMREKPIDDFYRSVIVDIGDKREKILTDRIKLVIKQQPRFIPRKLWLKLAAIFLQINHEKYVSDPPLTSKETKEL